MHLRGFNKIIISAAAGIALTLCSGCLAFKLSPWPSVLLIRQAFNKNAVKVNHVLEKHVPVGVSAILNEHYDMNDPDAFLDVYYPSEIAEGNKTLPVIVWAHGGGWVSGSKAHVANYCKILAAKGYIVVAVDYSIAPEKKYPTPVRQVNAALAYLAKNADRLHINSSIFILGGDSGGAHIMAQVANITCSSQYANLMGIQPTISRAQLAGVILYCGAYDAKHVDLGGKYGWFLSTVLWSYIGNRDFITDPKIETATVIDDITPTFPPAFISAGNADPLEKQSRNFARHLDSLNVNVDTLFFPGNYTPALPHEYQFNLDNEAGQLALVRSVKFLSGLRR